MASEICIMCQEGTGRAGAGDDSLFFEHDRIQIAVTPQSLKSLVMTIDEGDGPLCPKCSDALDSIVGWL